MFKLFKPRIRRYTGYNHRWTPAALWDMSTGVDAVSKQLTVREPTYAALSVGSGPVDAVGVKVTGTASTTRLQFYAPRDSVDIGAGDFTAFTVFRLDSTTGTAVFGRFQSANNALNDWLLGAYSQFSLSTADFAVTVGSTDYKASVSHTWTAGYSYALIGRRKGTSIYVDCYCYNTKTWKSGSTTNAAITTVNYNATKKLVLGSLHGNAGWNSSLTGFIAGTFKRCLTNSETYELARDPWQLLTPQASVIGVIQDPNSFVALPPLNLTFSTKTPSINDGYTAVSLPLATLVLTANAPYASNGGESTVFLPSLTFAFTSNVPTVTVTASQAQMVGKLDFAYDLEAYKELTGFITEQYDLSTFSDSTDTFSSYYDLLAYSEQKHSIDAVYHLLSYKEYSYSVDSAYDLNSFKESASKLDSLFDLLAFSKKVSKLNAAYDLLAATPSIGFIDTKYDLLAFSEKTASVTGYYDLYVYDKKTGSINSYYDFLSYKKAIGFIDSTYTINVYAANTASLDTAYDLLAYVDSVQFIESTYDLLAYADSIGWLSGTYDLLANIAFYGWMMNRDTNAVSRITYLDFNSMSDNYGCREDGIYHFEGTDNNGFPINAFIETGDLKFKSNNLKRVTDAYIMAQNDGYLELTLTGSKEIKYRVAKDKTSVYPAKINLARGEKSQTWTAKLSNVNGTPFKLDYIELIEQILARRV